MRFIVLDQHAADRDKPLLLEMLNTSNCPLLLSNAYFYELLQNEGWKIGARIFIEKLLPYKSRIIIGFSHKEIIQAEIQSHRATRTNALEDVKSTSMIRAYFDNIPLFISELERLGLPSQVADTRRRASPVNVFLLKGLSGNLKTGLDRRDLKFRIPGNDLINRDALMEIIRQARSAVEAILRDHHYNASEIASFCRLDTFLFRFFLTYISRCWDLSDRGWQDKKDKFYTNENYDIEYVTLASYSWKFACEDAMSVRNLANVNRAITLTPLMKYVYRPKPPWHSSRLLKGLPKNPGRIE